MSMISDAIIGQMQSAGQPRVSTATQTVNQAPEGLDLSSIGSLILMMLMMQDPKANPGELGGDPLVTETPLTGLATPRLSTPGSSVPLGGVTNQTPGIMGLNPAALMKMIMSMGMR